MCRLLLGMGLGLIGNARLRDGRFWRQVSILIDNLLSPILTDWILIEYQIERQKLWHQHKTQATSAEVGLRRILED